MPRRAESRHVLSGTDHMVWWYGDSGAVCVSGEGEGDRGGVGEKESGGCEIGDIVVGVVGGVVAVCLEEEVGVGGDVLGHGVELIGEAVEVAEMGVEVVGFAMFFMGGQEAEVIGVDLGAQLVSGDHVNEEIPGIAGRKGESIGNGGDGDVDVGEGELVHKASASGVWDLVSEASRAIPVKSLVGEDLGDGVEIVALDGSGELGVGAERSRAALGNVTRHGG
mmetsp:Transcript_6505/g.19765  ORF Transcript_6505/g.19765 Transcript_6505/m.19765 type:complete len:222 (+) Transcript_6505:336-1001(+)